MRRTRPKEADLEKNADLLELIGVWLSGLRGHRPVGRPLELKCALLAVLLVIQPWKGGLPADLHPQNLMELGLQLKLELAASREFSDFSASVLHIRCSRR